MCIVQNSCAIPVTRRNILKLLIPKRLMPLYASIRCSIPDIAVVAAAAKKK
jgi:hypothetical protein